MAEVNLLDFRISEESQDSDVGKLIKVIKPLWNLEKLQIKGITGGFSSRILRCYEENNPEDSLVIRIRHRVEKLLKDKPPNILELNIIQYLPTVNHFPKVHAIFANGYCYQYIEGMPMINTKERTGRVDGRMLRAIAEEMAFIHSIKLDGVEYNEDIIFSCYDAYFKVVDFETPKKHGLNKKVLLKELDLISNHLKSQNAEVVLIHGDPHPGNYVWNKELEKVTFVDWEGSRIGYQLAEIAHFFVALDLIEYIYAYHNKSRIIDGNYKRQFVKYYVETWFKLKEDSKTLTDDEINQWMENIETFGLMPHFTFVTFAYVFENVFENFSGSETIVEDVIHKNYLTLKEKVFGRRSFEEE